MSRTFKVRTFAATKHGVVGHTSIALFCDEMARWEARDSAANPAREVLGSLRPTTATQPFAPELDCSAPWGVDDLHHELFEQGNTDAQIVSFAPSWIGNPSLSEERTHELEPDPRMWSREYAAQPGATVSAALDADDVAACFAVPVLSPGAIRHSTPFCAIDASSLRGDAFAWLTGRALETGKLVVHRVAAVEGEELRRVTMADVVARVAEDARDTGAWKVYADQREEASLRSLFSAERLSFHSYAWSEQSKDDSMQWLRRAMRERNVQLPDDPKLRAELVAIKARLVPSGRIRYDHSGDRASALITVAHAVVAGDLRMTGPIGRLIPNAEDELDRARAEYCRRFGFRDFHAEERAARGRVSRGFLPAGYRRGGWR